MVRWRARRLAEGAVGRTLAAVGIASSGVAVVALLARQFAVGWSGWIVLAAFAHQLLWAAVPGVVLLLIARRWRTAGVAVVVAVAGLLSQLPLYRAAATPSGGVPVMVMQANLRLGRADAGALVRTVIADHVDVLTTEELSPAEAAALTAAGLGHQLPYSFQRPAGGGRGVAIWSRYRLASGRSYPGFELGVVSAVVSVPGARPTSVVAVHQMPPYPMSPGRWLTELATLHGVLDGAARAGPVVVGGDFNATTDNRQFRALLTDGYRDGAESAGAGYLPTYPADTWYPPEIAIDHVLVRVGAATSARTARLAGSDHRALLVRTVLPDQVTAVG